MVTGIDKLTEAGCSPATKDRVCRSRGGESCAFDGAMIVLQPIADTAHIVHGPIACCGNSWEGRGTLSSRGSLFRMGFTTDIEEMDIVYGSESKLYRAVMQTYQSVRPKAVFVYATCVSGLIGEDIDTVCRNAEKKLGIPVIPVNAPGFVGPKNLGNRIAGEVLLNYVIGTGEPPFATDYDINLIGEYNIAGDLWLVEPLLREAGIRVLTRITGDAGFEEITYAHRAKLNVLVCSRALINVAKEMERKYGIPYVEVSFFGRTEMSKALRLIGSKLGIRDSKLKDRIEEIISREETAVEEKLGAYDHLKGKKAVLYTGGVKSWSFISALRDLGIEVVAVGSKKSTAHDEEKMREILGKDAPVVEDVSPKNLLRLIRERKADVLVAGGRNQYLAIKEGYPFVDVNQERHTAYAGYEGLLNLAEAISGSIHFYRRVQGLNRSRSEVKIAGTGSSNPSPERDVVIDPLKHSPSLGAVIAFQGIHEAIPVIHGAQGCTFLGKVLLTKHFREPIALVGTRLFAEDVIMGSDENLSLVLKGLTEKNGPAVVGLLTSGLSEVKGDDVEGFVKTFIRTNAEAAVLPVSTPDYAGGLEAGYARAVEALITLCEGKNGSPAIKGQINVLAGSHLTPADFSEIREIIESFGLRPVLLPDLSALDGSRQGVSPLATGGTKIEKIVTMGLSQFTLALGPSMESPAKMLKDRFDIGYRVFKGLCGLRDSDELIETLSRLSGMQVPEKYARQRRILMDTMRDAHFFYHGKRVCIALEPDLSLQISRVIDEMGARVKTAVLPHPSAGTEEIPADEVVVGDLFSLEGAGDLLISNSHAEDTARRLSVPLYQTGFPVYKILGNTTRITVGYRGSLGVINDIGNMLIGSHGTPDPRKEERQ